ncbi:hypothetical protein [Glaciimonas sp. PCH181]|uniref:hypothetical protein n=1 Tax=Glaciimonas sp. PCH181 TaxID=2133943 RepID=UPI0011B1DB8A|nr:hypothetical protein [Glaciimonas sp. PCH181]
MSVISVGRGQNCPVIVTELPIDPRAPTAASFNKSGDSMTGPLLQADGTTSAPSYSFSNSPSTGIVNSAGTLVLTSQSNFVDQRNGATAQGLRVSNTWTDASNNEYGVNAWIANVYTIGTQNAGTGVARSVSFVCAAVAGYTWGVGGANKLVLGTTALAPSSNAGLDLGFTNLGWKRFYLDASIITVPGNATLNKTAGRVVMAAGTNSITVTSNVITANSIITASLATNDVTCNVKSIVAAAGSFTINSAANATADTSINFITVSI